MTGENNSTFQLTSWNESIIDEICEGIKLTRAIVEKSYSGAIIGVGYVQYHIAYTKRDLVDFVGFEKICGSIDGKQGTFVIKHLGSFVGANANSEWTVVPGMGTDQLTDMIGSGSYTMSHHQPGQVTFAVSFGTTD